MYSLERDGCDSRGTVGSRVAEVEARNAARQAAGKPPLSAATRIGYVYGVAGSVGLAVAEGLDPTEVILSLPTGPSYEANEG